ncbi:MAG: PKD domain-containing protein, partial [Candidatus Staskawiczbacteria bacterium]|nr:PKD domain-containing protein [Candidatus Staskawiczbacteria bacterium]
NPGTANSSCSQAVTSQLKSTCTANQTCSGGSCSNINVACSTNSQCGANGYVGSPYCQGGDIYQNYRTYTCKNPGTANSTCSDSSAPQLKSSCTSGQTCSSGICTNVNIPCSTNSQCGTNNYIGGPFCMGNGVYKNYTTHTCNNPGTANSSCSQATAPQLQNTCNSNQTCSLGNCGDINVACSTNSQCGTNGYIDGPYCQGNSVYQNYKTYTCNNPGTANSSCSQTTVPQLKDTCTSNQTCSNGSCNQQNNLDVSTSVYPSSPRVNQSVTFTSSVSGGVGNYTYSWTGDCTSHSANCNTTFNQSGTYTAYLSVTSGNQTETSTESVNVGRDCDGNTTQRCVGNSVYRFDSCGNQQELIQSCGYNQICSNNTCTQNQQNYTTVQTNQATNINGNQATLNGYLSGININNTNYVWFQWGNTTSYGYETNHQTMNYTGSFSQNIAGLSPGIIYHFRAVAQDYNGQIVYGQDISFLSAQVLGATTISTGLTNNFLVDSFFLPLIIALLSIWLFKSGILNVSGWVDSRRINRRNYVVGKQLKSKITEIKSRENLN